MSFCWSCSRVLRDLQLHFKMKTCSTAEIPLANFGRARTRDYRVDLVIAPFVLFWDLSQKNVGQNAVFNGSARVDVHSWWKSFWLGLMSTWKTRRLVRVVGFKGGKEEESEALKGSSALKVVEIGMLGTLSFIKVFNGKKSRKIQWILLWVFKIHPNFGTSKEESVYNTRKAFFWIDWVNCCVWNNFFAKEALKDRYSRLLLIFQDSWHSGKKQAVEGYIRIKMHQPT